MATNCNQLKFPPLGSACYKTKAEYVEETFQMSEKLGIELGKIVVFMEATPNGFGYKHSPESQTEFTKQLVYLGDLACEIKTDVVRAKLDNNEESQLRLYLIYKDLKYWMLHLIVTFVKLRSKLTELAQKYPH